MNKTVDADHMVVALDVDLTLLRTLKAATRSEGVGHMARDVKEELAYIKQRLQAKGYSVSIRINTHRITL